MSRIRTALAIVIGALIVLVLPDYIGLSIGFSSFIGHDDLTSTESRQFAWLSAYSAAMAVLLGGLAVSVLLCFTRLASKAFPVGIFIAASIGGLACVHIATIYLTSDWIASKTWEQFISPSERHAWISLGAALLAVATFFLPGSAGRGGRPTAESKAM